MRNTTGTDAASANDQPTGILATSRWSATTVGPNAPSMNRPNTRSPGANPVTPGPTSSTTPAPSLPIIATPGYMPSPTRTSRKFRPAARTAIRTCPGSSGARACGAGNDARFSRVPTAETSIRHVDSPASERSAPLLASVANCGTYAVPARTATCGSPASITAGTTAVDASPPSRSSSTNRPGFSDCAVRTRPQTAAPARSRTSSCVPTATAPVVTNTNRVSANRWSANQNRISPSASCVASTVRSAALTPRSSAPTLSTTSGTAVPSVTPQSGCSRLGQALTRAPAVSRASRRPMASGPMTT